MRPSASAILARFTGLRTIEILELGRMAATSTLKTSRQDQAVVGCDGLVLDSDDLWREVDRVEAADPDL